MLLVETAEVREKKAAFANATREERIVAHHGLARQMALRMAGRLPSCVELDDLIGAGMLGLVDAVDRFDVRREIPFEAYARMRIQGAILDALRAEDHLSRRDRRKGREADRAEDKLRCRLKREPTLDEVHKARRGVPRTLPHAMAFVSIDNADDALLVERSPADAFSALATVQSHGQLRAAVAELGERDRIILSLYYEQELTYREIGGLLGVTESRICQLLRAAHACLKVRLENQL
ncbi:MAG TPA: sigma-70 family RNA polymerase sigma factor [Myxococcales bacterium]|nr:sigma-70 family RNA polymerase sigma factor [Myxococcales bacterium]